MNRRSTSVNTYLEEVNTMASKKKNDDQSIHTDTGNSSGDSKKKKNKNK
jgi:hypothetical protein